MNTYRTDVPGLVVRGSSRRRYWTILHEPSGLPIAPAQLGNMLDGYGRLNMFDTRRAALEAVRRLAALKFDWTAGVETINDGMRADPDGAKRHRQALADALRGDTAEERAEAMRERRQREHAWYSGEGSRDKADAKASELGHAINWRKTGQRSYRGRCVGCGAEARSSYASMAQSYSQFGDALREACGTQEAGTA